MSLAPKNLHQSAGVQVILYGIFQPTFDEEINGRGPCPAVGVDRLMMMMMKDDGDEKEEKMRRQSPTPVMARNARDEGTSSLRAAAIRTLSTPEAVPGGREGEAVWPGPRPRRP